MAFWRSGREVAEALARLLNGQACVGLIFVHAERNLGQSPRCSGFHVQ
jgi:hypothetical protein